jgi:ornithine cyclodeaminase/alanine dehydrogenase-like protein (mu-crystallin family)
MKLTLLSAEDLRTALPMPAAIAAMKSAFAELSIGQAIIPLRTALPVPSADGVTLFMPAHLPTGGLGAKIVSVFPHNPELGKPVVNGLIVMLDSISGEPVALCDGTFLTAWRTGAGSGAATDLLARSGAKIAAVLGSGVQARTQALAIDAVRKLDVIRVYSPQPEHVKQFIAEMQPQLSARLVAARSSAEAVRGADIICTATTSATPVLDGQLLKPGAHINGVGSYTIQMQEVDALTATRSRVFVDSRASALAEAGDLVIPLQAGQTRAENWTEIGEVVAGLKPGRQFPEDITFFKSVGVAVQDVAAAGRALVEARLLGLGKEVEF